MSLIRRHQHGETGGGLPSHTTLTCPHNGHQVSFCRGLCTPFQGHGTCGRLAPHAMIGRTQAAIAAQRATASNQ